MSTKNIINELVQISKTKYRHMQIILGIQKNLSKYIELDKTQNIAKQIELKDKYLHNVDKTDVTFYNLFNELKKKLDIDTLDEIDATKYPQLRELKKTVVEILKLNEDIDIIDKKNIKSLEKHRNEISNKLKGIKQGRQASKAYRAQKNLKK